MPKYVSPAVTSVWSKALAQAAFATNPFVGLEEVRLFADSSEGGFMFKQHEWKQLTTEDNWRWRYLKDGIAHRDEAMRRMIVCRLDGNRPKEVEHWCALMRYFENLFKLTELTPDGSTTDSSKNKSQGGTTEG